MSKIIGVDIDLTVVDTYTPWMRWFEEYSGRPVQNESSAYDLVPEMKELLKGTINEGLDPFAFWRKPDLYDGLQPLPGAFTGLSVLKSRGWKVVFVSSCVPEHTGSKIRFLDKWFPWRSGFIATHEKEFVNYDVLIDDKLEHMRIGHQQRPHARHILFTGVRKDGTPEIRQELGFEEMSDWAELNTKLGF
jgi:5'(3')-deoxyribonucleotidase